MARSSKRNRILRNDVAALAAAVTLALSLAVPAQAATKVKAAPAKAAAPLATPEFIAAAQALDARARELARAGGTRGDGYAYGMDVAPMLLYAAERKDEALYGDLRAVADKLVVTSDNAAIDGFGLWRAKSGADPEISGAEETLWLARAYFTGGRAFGRSEDRAIAGRLLGGYARHGADSAGVWGARKYYSFGGGTFASLSVLSAYQGDFVSDAESLSPAARGVGAKSYTVVQRASTPGKLLLPLVQPQFGDLFPGMFAQRFAPNDVVMLEESCAAAEGAQRGLPDVAKGVLAFTAGEGRMNADGRLYAYYDRRSGAPVGAAVLGSSGYACLGRLAVKLGDRKAAAALIPVLTGDMTAAAAPGGGGDAPLYNAGPLLRAALALGAF